MRRTPRAQCGCRSGRASSPGRGCRARPAAPAGSRWGPGTWGSDLPDLRDCEHGPIDYDVNQANSPCLRTHKITCLRLVICLVRFKQVYRANTQNPKFLSRLSTDFITARAGYRLFRNIWLRLKNYKIFDVHGLFLWARVSGHGKIKTVSLADRHTTSGIHFRSFPLQSYAHTHSRPNGIPSNKIIKRIRRLGDQRESQNK